MDKPYLILGLDIGIASCGWALLDIANCRIVDMGVHLWDAPQQAKTKQSLAAIRRAARSSRRNTKRSADRAKHCVKLFIKHGLIPKHANKAWMQTVKGDPQPLESRVAALDGPIDNRHLAQALYNISLRRGYIPHGEGCGADDAEGRKVLSALSENEKAMAENGWRTVGEMMLEQGRAEGACHGKSRNHGGDYSRCVRMSQLESEANAIIEAQRAFGNELMSEEFQKAFIECMTWEKDTAEHDARVYSTVAQCVYFPELKAAAKSCLSFELCQAFERVNHVRIVDPHGAEQGLPPDIKRWCMEVLFSPKPLPQNKDCKITYGRLRKKMDLSAHLSFKGVPAFEEKDTEVATPKIWRLERKQLLEVLMEKMLANRDLADAVGSALAYSSREETLKARLEPLPLEDEEIDALCALPFATKAFSGYGTRSVKALQMLTDSFESYDQIETLFDAEQECGLFAKRSEERQKGNCLPAYQEFDPTNNNPVVLRVMARVRKVVNAVIREYGMPNQIHVELARELKQSEKEKAQIYKSNNERKTARNSARETLAEDLKIAEESVPGDLLRKKMLWDEQEGRDLYSDEPIEYERMIRDSTYCQVDHILPYSRTCDDSQSNKVLVLAKSNQDKKERSPYEWLQPLGKWDAFGERIRATQKIPYKKKLKFLEPDLKSKEEGFIERNMNDTRYATRAALNYIDEYLAFPDDGKKRHVYAVAGGATAALRGAWGFAAKDRDKDDCHHAMDAAVIAACDASTVIKIARASERKHLVSKEERKTLFRDTEPWEGFAQEVQRRVDELVPTRRVEHGGTARLFEDTVYKYHGLRDKGDKAIIESGGKTKVKGNFCLREDGSAVLPDGMMMLRLWWSGKKYLKEPVYYADLAAIRDDSYIPRYFVGNLPRGSWPAVPEDIVSKGEVVAIRYGDAVMLGDELLRFKRINTADGSLKFSSCKKFAEEISPKGSISKAKDSSYLRLIHEDVLGLCYWGEFKTSESSEPQDQQLRFDID